MKCAARTTALGIYEPLVCDREQGHKGFHRGYVAQTDSVFFWPEPQPSPELNSTNDWWHFPGRRPEA